MDSQSVPVQKLSFYKDEDGYKQDGYGDFLGFHFMNGTRYKMYYASALERAWCETRELVDEKLWEEANEKCDEYLDLCVAKPDDKLVRRVCMGYNNWMNRQRTVRSGGGGDQKKDAFRADIADHQCNLFDCYNSSKLEKIVEAYYDCIESYATGYNVTGAASIKEATVEKLVEIGDAWVGYHKAIAENAGVDPYEYGDSSHDIVHCIIDELASRKEHFAALTICKDMLNSYDLEEMADGGDFYRIFQRFRAELSEVVGNKVDAKKAYMSLKEFEDDDESESWVEACPNGSLGERITRTSTTGA